MRALHWLFVIVAIANGPAFGQAVLLQAGPLTPGHAPMYSQSGQSQPVVQDSGTAGGGVVGATLSELGITVRGNGTPPFVNGGKGPNGENVCDYDAPIDNATGFHYICLSPNAQGGALISAGAGGTASPQPLNFLINGALIAFPGAIVPSSFADNLVATGSTQGTAFPISATTNAFGTVPNGTGSILPVAGVPTGTGFKIINAGANSLSVYPPTGQTINGNSTNVAVTIYPNDVATFIYRGPSAWYAQ